MLNRKFAIIGGTITIIWGIAHLFPTASIVAGFGDISPDNKNIILMEWINEGLTLIFIGITIVSVTIINREINRTLKYVYVLSSLMLFIMAIVSIFTGFKIDFMPFKLCPLIFILSGVMILLSLLLKKDD